MMQTWLGQKIFIIPFRFAHFVLVQLVINKQCMRRMAMEYIRIPTLLYTGCEGWLYTWRQDASALLSVKTHAIRLDRGKQWVFKGQCKNHKCLEFNEKCLINVQPTGKTVDIPQRMCFEDSCMSERTRWPWSALTLVTYCCSISPDVRGVVNGLCFPVCRKTLPLFSIHQILHLDTDPCPRWKKPC